MTHPFPLPFQSNKTLEKWPKNRRADYLVAGMYTASRAHDASRLAASCEQFGIPCVLHEVPVVHNSISVKGSPDPRFTKPNFIRHMLDQHRRPILYLDIDCVLRSPPALIDDLVARGTGFAVYNWLADPENEAFYPVTVRLNGEAIKGQFYAYSHRVPLYSESQLICSGLTQLYDTSIAAARLLALWQETIEKFQGSADDQCLGFAFNNRGGDLADLRYAWIPKEYARCAWWIFTRPVIDHPGLPGLANLGYGDMPTDQPAKPFYIERCEPTGARFDEDSVIDVTKRLLYSLHDGRLTLAGPLEMDLWISDEAIAPATVDITERA